MKASGGPERTIINCFVCGGGGGDRQSRFGARCNRCGGSGKMIWHEGRGYRYTPEGERSIRREEKTRG